MKLIPITSVVVPPNRQRKKFDELSLQELIASIRDSEYGLLHPIVLRKVGAEFVLVAGERRLRAIQDIYDLGGRFQHQGSFLPVGMLPYVDLGDLDPLAAEEAELEENIRREDLTWQERAATTTRLMALRKAQAVDRGEPEPKVADIAREVRSIPADKPDGELGDAATQTKRELIVSRFLHDPAVAAAPNLNDAFKILKRQEVARSNSALAAVVGKTFSSQDHVLIHGPSEEWAATSPENRFDIILSDPPYGMGADSFGTSGTSDGSVGAHAYDDSYESWCATLDWFVPATARLAKPSAHLYLFCDPDRFGELRERVRAAGWEAFRTPLVWYNRDGFRAPWPDAGPQRKYEFILYARRGGRPVNAIRPDVLDYRKDSAVGHPAQKPVDLLSDLLGRSAKAGDTVWDPFVGSGSTIVAAHRHKCPTVGIERDATFYGAAVKRLGELK